MNDEDEVVPLSMETQPDRLRRFQDGPPTEVISTLLNSINNFLNPEIAIAAETKCWSLMLIGTHAVALTISYGLFGLNGEPAFLRFLREYVDKPEPGSDFSTVGSEVHAWRNIVAHQWLGTAGHTFGFDPTLATGWEWKSDTLVVNPTKYHEGYRDAFRTSSPLWRPENLLTTAQLQEAKERLIKKFQAR